MLKQVLVGGAAGAIATVPMSGVIWGFRRAGLYQRKPPPETVAERVTGKLTGLWQPRRRRWQPLKLAQHFGFGAAGGAAFGLLSRIPIPKIVGGLLVGLSIWAASYAGWLPASGIMPPPQKDEKGRVLTMIVAHAVYGLTLGAIVDRWSSDERSHEQE